jgi:hypothetical protein
MIDTTSIAYHKIWIKIVLTPHNTYNIHCISHNTYNIHIIHITKQTYSLLLNIDVKYRLLHYNVPSNKV